MEFFHSFSSNILNPIFYFLTSFGSGEIVFAIVISLYYCFNKELAKKLSFVLSTSFITNGILKSLFLAKRPFQFAGKEYLRKMPNSDGATGTSFPSGHSQNAGTLYTSLILSQLPKIVKIASIVLLILVPISRIYLGVHFFGDVIVGLSVGIILAFVLNFLYDKIKDKNYYHVFHLILLAVTIPFLIINWNNPNCGDLFKSAGLAVGIYLSNILETKYIKFTTDVPIKNKLIRLLIGIVVTLVIKSGVKLILPSHNIFQLIRYFLMAFVVLAVIPFFFKGEKNGKYQVL